MRHGVTDGILYILVLQPGSLAFGSQASTKAKSAVVDGKGTARREGRATSDSRVAGHGPGDFSRWTPSYDTETSVSAVRVAG
ncbi:hypothetical protein BKA61DRAFT_666755 [Leptodontidium sp. MPI-SDFR-AT-0119]|nr:hypothetical protein BKA61DRAFT_666755 [Leptodontidium sp. MPI-SDFR-AT-0119]